VGYVVKTLLFKLHSLFKMNESVEACSLATECASRQQQMLGNTAQRQKVAYAVMAERNALEKLDVGALNPEQQEKLHHFKVFRFRLLKVVYDESANCFGAEYVNYMRMSTRPAMIY